MATTGSRVTHKGSAADTRANQGGRDKAGMTYADLLSSSPLARSFPRLGIGIDAGAEGDEAAAGNERTSPGEPDLYDATMSHKEMLDELAQISLAAQQEQSAAVEDQKQRLAEERVEESRFHEENKSPVDAEGAQTALASIDAQPLLGMDETERSNVPDDPYAQVAAAYKIGGSSFTLRSSEIMKSVFGTPSTPPRDPISTLGEGGSRVEAPEFGSGVRGTSGNNRVPSPQSSGVEAKAVYYLDYLRHRRPEVRYGALQALHRLGPQVLDSLPELVQELISCLESSEPQEENFVSLSLRFLVSLGKAARAAIPLVVRMLRNPQLTVHRRVMCLFIISAGGVEGLDILLTEAQENPASLHEDDGSILTEMANFPLIMKEIIVPALMQESERGELNRRVGAVVALGRLGEKLAVSSLPTLVDLLQSGAVDRHVVVRAMRNMGHSGGKALHLFATKSINPRVRAASVHGLGIRPSVLKELSIKISVSSGFEHVFESPNNPRLLAIDSTGFAAPIELLKVVEAEYHGEKPDYVIDFDSRDFVARVRLAVSRGDISDKLFEKEREALTPLQGQKEELVSFLSPSRSRPSHLASSPALIKRSASFSRFAVSTKPSSPSQAPDPLKRDVTKATVNVIIKALEDEDAEVRQAACDGLGAIGPPEALPGMEALVAAGHDPDNKVRDRAAAAVGSFGEDITPNGINSLMLLLRDDYWKVRYSACRALGSVGEAATDAIPSLLRILNDGSIKRHEVAATLASMGEQGESALIEVLQKETNTHVQARVSAAYGLSLADVASPNIERVAEALCRSSRDRQPLVCRGVLKALGALGLKANESVTYLRARNLLPFIYAFLKDRDFSVRCVAAKVLAEFGPHGELLLIKGVLKDSHPVIRCSSAYGLQHVGPRAVRTLLLAFSDRDPMVREAVVVAIEDIGLNRIVDALSSRPESQRLSVVHSAQDILNSPYPYPASFEQLLNTIIARLQGDSPDTDVDSGD